MGTMRLYRAEGLDGDPQRRRARSASSDRNSTRSPSEWGSKRKLVTGDSLTIIRSRRLRTDAKQKCAARIAQARSAGDLRREISMAGRRSWPKRTCRVHAAAAGRCYPRAAVPALRLHWRRYSELLTSMENDSRCRCPAFGALRDLQRGRNRFDRHLGARLDELGSDTVGGLHFRLNRSAYYVREFQVLLKTLHVSNIQTWISYEQFVQRGLAPAFD